MKTFGQQIDRFRCPGFDDVDVRIVLMDAPAHRAPEEPSRWLLVEVLGVDACGGEVWKATHCADREREIRIVLRHFLERLYRDPSWSSDFVTRDAAFALALDQAFQFSV